MLLPDREAGQGVEVVVVLGGGEDRQHEEGGEEEEQPQHGGALPLLVGRLLGQTGLKDSRFDRKKHL